MSLSDELISQFVKSTKDDKQSNDEVTTYGEISVKEEGGKKKVSVVLDGSEEPISLDIKQLTVSVTDGDRVRVSIKNHSLCVTGNLSDHSASSGSVEKTNDRIDSFDILVADKVSTEELAVERARIDVLSADYADISGTLSANEADISNLKASNVTITEKLNAAEADIKDLEADKLDANTAILTYATIKDLDAAEADIYNLNAAYGEFVNATADNFSAVNAKIDNLDANHVTTADLEAVNAEIDSLKSDVAVISDLQSDVAEIDTLIFGSASGEVIHSSFSNAVIAQLGDAQIKAAMIESVSADKITAGDIITNDVRVLSENGRLIISDETMQISDSTRVRVQIGKDASNDYSINIWDAEGNLMFSKGGITDSAIKSAIIRNDMVSDTANISAHKLNIDSLFEEINGSTKTIKSTRIYLDDDKQTLDVAFKTLTTETDELSETVSSQGTQIAAVQGQITSKVWQQDINTATNNLSQVMSSKYSEFEQEIDSITQTVSSHTTEINNKANASDLTALQKRVTSAETSISNTATEIALRATKSEVETAKSEAVSEAAANTTTQLANYSTTSEMTAAIELKANGIVSSVRETYATKNDLSVTDKNVATAQSTAEEAAETAVSAETLVAQLSDSIASLVTDGNGTSLMTQTDNGWTFSTAEIQNAVNSISENLSTLTDDVGDVDNTITILQQAIDDLGEIADYVRITTFNSEPCIELGEGDSDFKLRITNTQMIFTEGSETLAYFTNKAFNSKKVVIEEELQQGSFVWKIRANGNLGLMWIGGNG